MKSIEKWDNRKLAAQCIMPRLSADKFYSEPKYKTDARLLVEEGIGGFCIFAGNAIKTSSMINELQSISEIPLIFSADFENGMLMRLDDGTGFPHAMALGKARDPERAHKVASFIAKEAKSIGIHWNLAPVCDINSNKKNPIINIRSFGETPEEVIHFTESYIKGTQTEKVLACAKHFPGHGDTETDSHISLPLLSRTANDIDNRELKPFANAVKAGVKSIMIAHLAIPSLDDSNTPASLSETIISGLLREKLEYKGLVITDALDMNSISDRYSSSESAFMAVNAGSNIVLLPPDPLEALDSLERHANREDSFRKKLEKSVELLIKEKRWCGLTHSHGRVDLDQKTNFESHEKFALETAFQAIDIDDEKGLIPLDDEKSFAALSVVPGEDMQAPAFFSKMLAQAVQSECDFAFINTEITDEDITSLKDGIKLADMLIFAFFYKSLAYKSSVLISDRINSIIKEFADDRPVIALLFGNPYIKDDIQADAYVKAYSDSISSIAASVLALSGRTPENI